MLNRFLLLASGIAVNLNHVSHIDISREPVMIHVGTAAIPAPGSDAEMLREALAENAVAGTVDIAALRRPNEPTPLTAAGTATIEGDPSAGTGQIAGAFALDPAPEPDRGES
jgi:hypothetical protein